MALKMAIAIVSCVLESLLPWNKQSTLMVKHSNPSVFLSDNPIQSLYSDGENSEPGQCSYLETLDVKVNKGVNQDIVLQKENRETSRHVPERYDNIHRVYSKPKDYGCDQCSNTFSNKENLHRHIKQVHLKIKDYGCDQCSSTFVSKENLNSHIKQINLKLKYFGCNQCRCTASRKGRLDRHIKKRHALIMMKDYRCDQCIYTSRH